MAFVLRKPPELTPKLDAYPYQLDAFCAIRDLPYAAVFHEQGLGKTKIAIDLVLDWLERDVVDTVFIITKKGLVHNWVSEFETHADVNPVILSDNRRANSIAFNAPVLVYIMNYEVILGNFEVITAFLSICRVGAVLDESHKIKNPNAKLTQSFLEISERFTRRVIMTGTPVANRPYDLWSQIYFLDGGKALGKDFNEFQKASDLPKASEKKDEHQQALSLIPDKLSHFTIRETKKSSGIELPEKIIKTEYVEMTPNQKKIYEHYIFDLKHEFETDDVQVLDEAEVIFKRLLRLSQCTTNPALIDSNYHELPSKFIKLLELIKSFDLAAGKLIIWTNFIRNAEWLAEKLADYHPVYVHGARSIDERNLAIERFKNEQACQILIATPGAAKEGLTLTVANRAIFYDRSFSLDDYLQAQDRIHRISQTRKCFVYNLIARDTLDEWVDKLLYTKFQAARLAQGDATFKMISEEPSFDLTPMLANIFSPNQEGT